MTAYSKTTESESSFVEVDTALIVGVTQYTKCKESQEACTSDFSCMGKVGIVASMAHTKNNDITHTKPLREPYTKPFKDMGYFMRTIYSRVDLMNFGIPDTCQGYLTHVGFNTNWEASDVVYPVYFEHVKLYNVEDGYAVYLEEPDPTWANPEKCLDYPCTGLNNAVITDVHGGIIG